MDNLSDNRTYIYITFPGYIIRLRGVGSVQIKPIKSYICNRPHEIITESWAEFIVVCQHKNDSCIWYFYVKLWRIALYWAMRQNLENSYSIERETIQTSKRSLMPQNKDCIKSNNIRRLIERSLKLWDAEKYKVLIQEVEMCDKKFWPHTTKMTEEQAIKVFTCFMLEGKTWAATYFITKRDESRALCHQMKKR